MKYLSIFILALSCLNSDAQIKEIRDFAEMTRFFHKNTEMPQVNVDNNEPGTIIALVTIEGTQARYIRTLLSLNYTLEQEVKRVIEKSNGKWKLFDTATNVILTFSFYFPQDAYESLKPFVSKDAECIVGGADNYEKKQGISNALFLKPFLISAPITCICTIPAEKITKN